MQLPDADDSESCNGSTADHESDYGSSIQSDEVEELNIIHHEDLSVTDHEEPSIDHATDSAFNGASRTISPPSAPLKAHGAIKPITNDMLRVFSVSLPYVGTNSHRAKIQLFGFSTSIFLRDCTIAPTELLKFIVGPDERTRSPRYKSVFEEIMQGIPLHSKTQGRDNKLSMVYS